jgi:hypothetical protein
VISATITWRKQPDIAMVLPDELRFGPRGVLNLREGLPSAGEAVQRAERWLRQHQVNGTTEVLIVTGRGQHSIGGIPVLRPAIEKLLFSLKRKGVVVAHASYNPGAFVVELAPLRTLAEAPARRRDRRPTPGAAAIHGLSRETTALLRDLAQHSLDSLGVTADESAIEDEMHRHLRLLAPGLTAGLGMEEQLRRAIRAMIAEYD